MNRIATNTAALAVALGCAGHGLLAAPTLAATTATAAAESGIAVEAAPQPPVAALAAWHSRYAPRAAPVKEALTRLLAARQEVDPTRYKRRYREACRLLERRVERFTAEAGEHALFPEADAAARFHLRRAYARLADAAAAGAAGHFQSAEIALADALRWFRQAALALERYGVAP